MQKYIFRLKADLHYKISIQEEIKLTNGNDPL